MTKPEILLSILIPGVPRRFEQGTKLVNDLQRQITHIPGADKRVEIIWLVDNYQRSIGAKRQALVDLAQGKYVIFIDDDDRVIDDYLYLVLEAIIKNPDVDVVTFDQSVDWNGKQGIISFQLNATTNEPFKGEEGVTIRKPWHVCGWKRSLTKHVKFPDLNWGEDAPWVDEITPKAKTEVHIPKVLHIYVHYDSSSESIRRLQQGDK